MSSQLPTDSWRTLLYALAAHEPDALAAWLEGHEFSQADLAWLSAQGLAMFAYFRLQQTGLLARVPAEIADPWEATYRRTVLATASMDWEIERVVAALTQAGVDFIWLKGAALAYTIYANPACRLRGDLDLWIPLEHLPLATALLAALGYHLHVTEYRPDALARLVGGEQQMVSDSSVLTLIELQWPALRGEWVRRTAAVDHAGIWRRRRPALIGQQAGWTMTGEDTLIHLCFHQAINHQFGSPWLRNLLDIHLLTQQGGLDWSQVAARAVAWRLAAVVWTTLDLTQRLLGATIPASVMEALAPARRRRWLIERLRLEQGLLAMHSESYSYTRFLVQMALVDRARDGALFLARGLFPEAAWLRARYELPAEEPLPRWRMRHLWQLATAARA